MSERFVALLRGINVGRAKRVAMADLRRILEGLGFREVRTLLNSGNVVFEASGDPSRIMVRIEKAFVSEMGFPSRVLVLRAEDLEAIVSGNPLAALCTNPSAMFVAFLWEPNTALHALGKSKWGREAFASGRRAVYLWCPDGMMKSPLLEAFHRAAGEGVTVRNWATVSKLHGMVRAGETPVQRSSPKPRVRRRS
jgi:uncharacterized protein (DUF1697 family)